MGKKLFPLILAAVMLLASCDSLSLIKITHKDGYYIDKQNGIKYDTASVSYEPVSTGDAYAKYGDRILYSLGNMNPKEWLSEEYDGIGSIYYNADEVTPPSLSEFNANKIYICVPGEIVFAISEITDKPLIKSVINQLHNGENSIMPQEIYSVHHLKFASEDFPYLYYNIVYTISDDGRTFLSDRGEKICVDAEEILNKYIIN
jgi:hypothetical protein